MDRLEEIKANIIRGRLPLRDMSWLVTEVETQREVVKELLAQTRYKSYMDMAKENLGLEESLKLAREQRDHYKQAYEASRKAL
ncbi:MULTISPECIES: hypothetical protein [unclassified Mesobacillus]|uniref:hypothetical protein n=1 Tax=unclassified Mesobacillus TaxID=2675270 RepID=UPI00203AC7EF|nr:MULTISPECIES: hypothetical protein [unclassified Mesobacillus]MCM3122758.1 hypothetical protein [Mesobacillus sp. MER 33]MCM3232722.1 hypothetical protein [Mesobacillus sp. MER 48]